MQPDSAMPMYLGVAAEIAVALLVLWLVLVAATSPIAALYNARNVFVRWRATLATVLGIALVVAVFVLVQALATGLEKSAMNTGDPRNLLIVRKGSTAESSSQVSLQQFQTIRYWPQIAHDEHNEPLVSADVVALISQTRLDGKGEANVSVRGVTPKGRFLRPQVKLVAGRWFDSGKREVVVSSSLARRFNHFQIGEKFKTAGNWLTVVGEFDGGGSAFDSEVWLDADEARAIFDRDRYSSVLVRAVSPQAAQEFSARIDADKRLPLRADSEVEYYAKQTATAMPIRILGNFLATAMSIGAIFAAMNTMYASVGARTREIGTLRVLGFRRRTILASFVLEGALLAAVGGGLGCLLALPMHGVSTGTMSFNTFSETVFQFRITPWLALKGITFAIVVGVIGSLLPAIRASRLPVIAALKSV
jgi:putative ABC transport system permease protein